MYFFDASSIIKAMKLKKIEALAGNYTQALAIYEALNALWKDSVIHKTLSNDEALKLSEALTSVVSFMKVQDPHGLEDEILKVALESGLTAYDSSYIVMAKRASAPLITEDSKLRRIASSYVKALSLDDMEGKNEGSSN